METMNIRVLFFARLRDQVGRSSLVLELPAAVKNLADLRQHLMTLDKAMATALAADDISMALNQQQCKPEEPVQAGDEVAFFPPVTGG